LSQNWPATLPLLGQVFSLHKKTNRPPSTLYNNWGNLLYWLNAAASTCIAPPCWPMPYNTAPPLSSHNGSKSTRRYCVANIYSPMLLLTTLRLSGCTALSLLNNTPL